MTTARKETADTIMSALGNEVDVDIHNPLLQERLQHPDTKANPNICNGSVTKTSLCSGSTNGCGDTMNNSEDENTSQSPVNDLHSTVNNMGQISKEESDCVSLCSQKCSQSEKNITLDCVDSEKPSAHKDENNVENLMCRLDTTLSDKSLVSESDEVNGITYVVYESEKQMPDIMRLITKDLSEPYSIYTYRYFIHNWPKLCFLAMDGNTCIGAIVCKLDMHKKMVRRGYIAMLAVDSAYRRRKLGSTLVTKAIQAMIRDDCDEVVLETEITNQAALHLYENLGFVRDKRLFRYYLNGVDALRLKLWLR